MQECVLDSSSSRHSPVEELCEQSNEFFSVFPVGLLRTKKHVIAKGLGHPGNNFFNLPPNICGVHSLQLASDHSLASRIWLPDFSKIFVRLCVRSAFYALPRTIWTPTVLLNSVPTKLQFLPRSRHNPSPSQKPTRWCCLGEKIVVYYLWYIQLPQCFKR